ncbi:aminotransferase class I/II-fold pyridoxal phosphate-dependent enzyme [Paenibacillus sp. GYB003]|uniref:aminotransferase class I/II-fold pyridoxal phosphate-dependent enzyme n=1 Tax=Paenibacillus sp. GYB003 TaxID=2994392 RepID=UPI002F964AAD
MDERTMPLLGALLRHKRSAHTALHVPGHKSGKGVQPAADILRELMTIDLTELTGLDDLHAPEGVIDEAQRLAAACFGAEETLFLVNGSTVGNIAAILSLCMPGDVLLVQRNAHKSVIHGLMLAGAKAVFLAPRHDAESGLPGGVAAEELELALRRYPDAKGVFITNPNYYGMGGDVRRLADLAHAYGKPLIVDEAHGAHYGFHPDVPPSALQGGADLVVQSTHKMLTAMTMGAMLHMQGGRIDRDIVKQRLSMLQSSSPSYPIMASLDASRQLVQTEGRTWLERGLHAVGRLYAALAQRPWYRSIAGAPTPAYETKDPFKVAVSDATGTLDGFRLRDELEKKGIMPEMADPRYVLLAFSPASDEEDAERTADALERIADEYGLPGKTTARPRSDDGASFVYPGGCSEPVAFGLDNRAETMPVPVAEAAGKLAGEMVIPYPPGIPVLYAGERITEETARYLRSLSERGARFQGATDPKLHTIRIRLR